MNLFTVTLNPALDVTILADGLDGDRANHVLGEQREAGGKGVNVGRVVKSFGIATRAFGLLGRLNAPEYLKLLGDSAGATSFFYVDGRVRENMTLRAESACMKLNREGAPYDKEALQDLQTLLLRNLCEGDVAAISGSCPKGMPVDDLIHFCKAIAQKGGLVALDSEALTLDALRECPPFLFKPNIHELAQLTGAAADTWDKLLDALRQVKACGVQNLLVSMGSDGMAALCGDTLYRVRVPKIEVKSTVGAGDSTVGGFLAALALEKGIPEALRWANACGCAAAGREGTGLGDADAAQRLLPEVTVEQL